MMKGTIGIISSVCGSGATHLGIAVSNYLVSGCFQTAAYVNLNGLLEEGTSSENGSCVMKQGVAYYLSIADNQIPLLYNQHYEWLLFDYGNEYQTYREEFLRCDIKIVVLNLSAWHRHSSEKLMHVLKGQEWGAIHPQYVCTFFEEKEKREFEKAFGEKVIDIPIFHHPFCIKKEQFELMGKLLTKAAAKKRIRRLHIPRLGMH